MSSVTEFSPQDWTLLKELPFKVILAVIVSDPSGPLGAASIETVHAARKLVNEATSHYANNALIMNVLREVADDPALEEDIHLDDDEARHAAIVEGIALSERANRLLVARPDATEAEEYKRWIYDAACAAAGATKSGGVLGFGASEFSDAEKDFLEQLRLALGLASTEE